MYFWENMHITDTERNWKCLMVFFMLMLIMLPAYWFQFKMQETVSNHEIYEQIDCKIYQDSIGSGI